MLLHSSQSDTEQKVSNKNLSVKLVPTLPLKELLQARSLLFNTNEVRPKNKPLKIIYLTSHSPEEFDELNIEKFYKTLQKKYPSASTHHIQLLADKELSQTNITHIKTLSYDSHLYIDFHSNHESTLFKLYCSDGTYKKYTPRQFAELLAPLLTKNIVTLNGEKLTINLIVCNSANTADKKLKVENTLAYLLCTELYNLNLDISVIGRIGEIWLNHLGQKKLEDVNGHELHQTSGTKFLFSHDQFSKMVIKEYSYAEKNYLSLSK